MFIVNIRVFRREEDGTMSGQRPWIKVWARTVGMPVGATDDDKPEFLPIKQSDVTKALAFRTFWIVLHVVTCLMIVAGNAATHSSQTHKHLHKS